MNDLTKRGYVCAQTRGSKGFYDIMSLPRIAQPTVPGSKVLVLLVQVKSGDKIVEHSAWNGLWDLARATLSLAIVADRDGRKIRYRLITGYHTYRSRDWPAEAYEP